MTSPQQQTIIKAYYQSVCGTTHPKNEDSVKIAPPFYGVADGVGGGAAGDVASSTLLNTCASVSMDTLDADGVITLLHKADADIKHALSQVTDQRGAATMVAAWLNEQAEGFLTWVGDARIYQIDIMLAQTENTGITTENTVITDAVTTNAALHTPLNTSVETLTDKSTNLTDSSIEVLADTPVNTKKPINENDSLADVKIDVHVNLTQLTRDHTYGNVADAIPKGWDADDPAHMVGVGKSIVGKPERLPIKLAVGQGLLLCSDGVHKFIPHQQMCHALEKLIVDASEVTIDVGMTQYANRLVSLAVQLGSYDDCSALVLYHADVNEENTNNSAHTTQKTDSNNATPLNVITPTQRIKS